MVSSVQEKLSAILKDMAWTLLRQPQRPSCEAAQVALLLAHVACGKSVGDLKPAQGYRQVLAMMEEAEPGLWEELVDTDPEAMIESLMRMKQERYPLDDRVVVVCGMRDGNVHVEWREESNARDAPQMLDIRRLVELIAAGKEKEAVEHLCRTTRISRQEAKRHIRDVRKAMEGGMA